MVTTKYAQRSKIEIATVAKHQESILPRRLGLGVDPSDVAIA